MGLKGCRECGVKVSTEAKTCPHCGVKKPVPSDGLLKWTILGIAIIVIVALVSRTSDKDKPVAPSSNIPQSAPELKKLSSSEHLSEAKKALADGYKPDKNPEKTRWGNVDKARQHLEAIPKDDPLSKDAAKLMAEVNRRQKEIEKLSKKIVDSMMAQTRKAMAEKMERVFLSNGMDARVYVSGKQNSVLTVEYILLNRAFAYKMTNEGDFYANAKKAGFKKLVFDNTDTTWTYDLTK